MAYPTKTWAKIKADYETGNYSVDELWKKCGKDGPTVRAIEEKIKKDNWQKGKLKPQIEKTMQQKIVEELANQGVNQSFIVSKIKDLLDCKKQGKPDSYAVDKGLTHFAKFTGSHAPEKQEKPPINLNFDAKDFDKENASQLINAYNELLKGLNE